MADPNIALLQFARKIGADLDGGSLREGGIGPDGDRRQLSGQSPRLGQKARNKLLHPESLPISEPVPFRLASAHWGKNQRLVEVEETHQSHAID